MNKLKSARHHWWPRCVSKHWADNDGFTYLITPDGSCKRVPPAKLGMIKNGHHIKFSNDIEGNSHWDSSFESEFDLADHNFPAVIDWLSELTRVELFDRELRNRFVPQQCSDNQLKILTECVVSLAIRSPRYRESSVSPAEHFRGKLPERERNNLIGLNISRSQRMVADSIKDKAKFAILFSSGKEFIYGDGLFNNITSTGNPPHNPKILVPITPMIGVIISKPMAFRTEPRLTTILLSNYEVEACNQAAQVYSKEALFYRHERPNLLKAFTDANHMTYDDLDNPIESLIQNIPGVEAKRSFWTPF